MNSQTQRILISFVAASLCTLFFKNIYTNTLHETQKKESLEFSTQIILQIESLTFYAREQNISQPVAWAVQMLSIGSENRPLQIKLIHDFEHKDSIEHHYIDSLTKTSHYKKILIPETSTGVDVMIHIPSQKFLDSSNPVVRDFLLFVCFILMNSFFLLILRQFIKPTYVEFNPSILETLQTLQLCAKTNHNALLELTSKVKKMTQSSKKMIEAYFSKPIDSRHTKNFVDLKNDLNHSISELIPCVLQQSKHITHLESLVTHLEKKMKKE